MTNLKELQEMPLEWKIIIAQARITEWYHYFNGNVYVAFSGGKDSTVLLHLVRATFPDVPAVFCDTGLEFPEVKEFVKSFDNVEIIKPHQSFRQVIEIYGYPVISKETAKRLKYAKVWKDKDTEKYNLYVHGKMVNGKPVYRGNSIPKKWMHLIDAPFKISADCCLVMKKRPFYRYGKRTGRVPYVGLMAEEGDLRAKVWKEHGCNAFDLKHPQSQPLSFWTDKDIWEYIHKYNLDYCKLYDMGYRRTGCMYCMFGLQFDEVDRFETMRLTHPKIYDYCMRDKEDNGLGIKQVLDYVNMNMDKQQRLW